MQNNMRYATLAIGVALALLLWLGSFLFSPSSSSSDEDQVQVLRNQDQIEIVTNIITKNYPTKAIEIPERSSRSSRITDVDWDIIRDDLAYWVEINGGTNNGGVEYLVPARKNWAARKYNPADHKYYVRNLRFKLDQGVGAQEAELRITARSYFP